MGQFGVPDIYNRLSALLKQPVEIHRRVHYVQKALKIIRRHFVVPGAFWDRNVRVPLLAISSLSLLCH